MDINYIGNKIRAIRHNKSMSQVDLAEKSGVSALTIVRIENLQITEPHLVTLKAIANALGVSVGDLKGE